MLRKMLKYDIQAMSKTFIPFFIAILVISVFSALSMHLEWLIGIFGGATILFGLGIALFVTSLVLIITQFYKNVLGDQGYLTNTLPVSVDTIILSKLFSAIFFSSSVLSLESIILQSLTSSFVGSIIRFFHKPLCFSDYLNGIDG